MNTQVEAKTKNGTSKKAVQNEKENHSYKTTVNVAR